MALEPAFQACCAPEVIAEPASLTALDPASQACPASDTIADPASEAILAPASTTDPTPDATADPVSDTKSPTSSSQLRCTGVAFWASAVSPAEAALGPFRTSFTSALAAGSSF